MEAKPILCARVVVWHGDSLLLQQDARLDDDAQFYRLPGGHIGADETPARAAEREFAEEMGFAAHIGRLLYVGWNEYDRKGKRAQEVVFYFAGRVDTALPTHGHVETHEANLRAHMVPMDRLAGSRSLPTRLFARLLADGPDGSNEVVYVEELPIGLHNE